MAKEKNSKHPKKEPEEYQFSEEEYGAEPVEKARRSSIAKRFFSRRVIVVLILIIAVLIVYQFVKPRGIKPETQTLEQQPTLQPVTTTATTALEPTPTPVTLPVMEGPKEPVPSELQQQVSSLAQQTQSQVGQLQQGVQQLQGQLAQVSNQVTTLASSVKTCAAQCPPKIVTPVVTKPKPKKVVVRPPVYYVRAVVPGRAWIYNKCGNTVVHLTTVKVGDFLPGYGRIQAISPSQGKVWTSWGTVIRYGVNDS